MSGWLIVVAVPGPGHTSPATYALVDTASVGAKRIVASFPDEHEALAVADVLVENERTYRQTVKAMHRAEPF